MAGEESTADRAAVSRPRRLRGGLRRHGVVRRPAALRAMLRGRALRFTEGNEVEVFEDGVAGLAAMQAAIGAARSRVHLETYILRADRTGRRFLAALEERAQAGVEVRLLYDALGSRGLDRSALAPLLRAGGSVAGFNPPRRWLPDFAPRRRDHRKVLVVDDEVAFVGGLNIGDEYARRRGGHAAWRDAHLAIRGPAVQDLEAVFLESWFRADAGDLEWASVLEIAPPERGDVRCAVLADGPVYHRRRMRELVVSALDDARERVLLVSPYFAPGRRVLDVLERCGERGVDVTLLLAGETDHPVLRRGARAFVPRLEARGVTVYEDLQHMMHAKVAVFDDDFAIVGTSNLDRQSLEHSYEVNVLLEGEAVASEIRECFAPDATSTMRIDLARLSRRGLLERLLDWVCAQLLRLV